MLASPRGAVLLASALLAAPSAAPASGPSLGDDGYHYGQFRDGAHDGRYVEWWYFNLVDESSGLSLAFTYSVVDPENRTGFGTTGLLAAAFTPDGARLESEYLSADRFHGSDTSANLVIENLGRVEVIDEASYHVTGAVSGEHRVSWDLTYAARSSPWLGGADERVGLLPWERMSWLVYMPAALVSGELVVDGKSYALTEVRGYHDHNWGEWILTDVIWNWGQYSETGFDLELGDFRRRAAGVLSVEVEGQRATFEKHEYRVLHTRWGWDEETRQWFPTQTRLLARNDRFALVASLETLETRALLPPPRIPFLLWKPVVFEQTARYSGTLWVRDDSGGWRRQRRFGGTGFKEYAARTAARPNWPSRRMPD